MKGDVEPKGSGCGAGSEARRIGVSGGPGFEGLGPRAGAGRARAGEAAAELGAVISEVAMMSSSMQPATLVRRRAA
jgi:hypothetical protein